MPTVARTLSAEYGRGFSRPNPYRMLRFAEVFPDEQIVSALRRQLTSTHMRELIAIDDPLKRQFYTEMCRIERWNTRTLRAKVGGMLFERTAIAKRPEVVINRDRHGRVVAGHDVRADPWYLDGGRIPASVAVRVRLNASAAIAAGSARPRQEGRRAPATGLSAPVRTSPSPKTGLRSRQGMLLGTLRPSRQVQRPSA